jgi:hypothetical protein
MTLPAYAGMGADFRTCLLICSNRAPDLKLIRG